MKQEGQQPEGDTAVAVIDANTKAFIHLEGLVDPVKAAEKLRKQAAAVMPLPQSIFWLYCCCVTDRRNCSLNTCVQTRSSETAREIAC